MRISNHELFPLYVDGKIDKNNAMQQAVGGFDRHEIDNLTDLYVLVSAEDTIYAPIWWNKNHRMIDNAIIEDIDLIVFDSDDGDTEEEILSMFDGFEILLLRTASWSKELEKYRIFIPLGKPISFSNPEEYKMFYRWLGDEIGLRYDLSTTECGRGYIGVAGKEGVLTKGYRVDPSEEWSEYLTKYNKREKRMAERRKLLNTINPKQEFNGTMHPSMLTKKPKFIEYYNNIYDGNYHSGIVAMIGYLKNSSCEKADVRDWLIEQSFGSADSKYIDQRMRMW